MSSKFKHKPGPKHNLILPYKQARKSSKVKVSVLKAYMHDMQINFWTYTVYFLQIKFEAS